MLETAVEIAAVIDYRPSIVTLERKAFEFTIDETATADLYVSKAASANYDSIVYKAQMLAAGNEPQLAPNFPADEKEFFYQSGKLIDKLNDNYEKLRDRD